MGSRPVEARAAPDAPLSGVSIRAVLPSKRRPMWKPIAILALSIAVGCELPRDGGAARGDPEPPYQDLDGGDGWPLDTDGPPAEGAIADFDDDAGGGDGGDDVADAAACLDIGGDDYQVNGSCPELPGLGAIAQDAGCDLAIPGQLGAVIGESGTIDGPYVTTERCTGLAEVGETREISLNCLIDAASCQVFLSDGG
jgi:hypothetical protein